MKIFGILFAVLVSTSVQAATPELTVLDCVGANGVRITTTEKTEFGIRTTSSWGFFKSEFVAKLDEINEESEARIGLYTAEGKEEYYITLPVNVAETAIQKSFGTILKPAIVRGACPLFVTAVDCKVQLHVPAARE